MNFFLYINRNFIIYIGLIILTLFLILILSKQFKLNNIEFEISESNTSKVDITEPKFAINNNSKNIYITAKEGNFINKDEIILKKNVKFRSNEFSIETENVIFNRKNQTAQSNTKSIFKSENTIIYSKGFNIHDKGNKIIFYGKSILILK